MLQEDDLLYFRHIQAYVNQDYRALKEKSGIVYNFVINKYIKAR